MFSFFELFVVITGIVTAFNLELLIFLVVLRLGHFHVL